MPAASVTDLLLHGEQLDDVLVVEFLQNLELPHLDVERPQKAQVVKHFDSVKVSSFLQFHRQTHSQTHVTSNIRLW